MDIFNYKCLNKKVEKNQKSRKYIKNLTYRILITIILFLICSILIKSNTRYKEAIYKNIDPTYMITIMRRMMYRISEKIMEKTL